MRRWLQEWFPRRDGVKSYFAARPLHGLDQDAAIALVEADVQRGVERERLVFALVMYAEWQHAATERLAQARNAARATVPPAVLA